MPSLIVSCCAMFISWQVCSFLGRNRGCGSGGREGGGIGRIRNRGHGSRGEKVRETGRIKNWGHESGGGKVGELGGLGGGEVVIWMYCMRKK